MISISYVYCEKTSSLRCQWSNSSIGPKKKRIMISVMEWNNAKKIRKYYVVLTRKSCSHSQLGPVQLRRSQPSCLLLSFLVLLFVCLSSVILSTPPHPPFVLKKRKQFRKKARFSSSSKSFARIHESCLTQTWSSNSSNLRHITHWQQPSKSLIVRH